MASFARNHAAIRATKSLLMFNNCGRDFIAGSLANVRKLDVLEDLGNICVPL